MSALHNIIQAEPQPAVCEWCGAWFHTAWQARYCDQSCAEAAYTAHVNAKTRAALLNEFEALASRGVIDASTLEVWNVTAPRETEALAGIRAQCLSGGVVKNAWLSGGPGVGKSFALSYALCEAFQHGQSIAKVSGRRLLRDGDRGDLWAIYQRSDVLVIDDIDKAVASETAASVLWEVLDSRASRRLYTMITANVTGSEWARTWEAGISSRYVQPSMDRLLPCVGIKCGGTNLRREAAKGDACES